MHFITETGRSGIYIFDGDRNTLVGNTVVKSEDIGILSFDGAGSNEILNNIVQDSRIVGVRIGGGEGNIVRNNILNNSGGNGIAIRLGSKQTIVIANTVTDNGEVSQVILCLPFYI